MSRRAQQQQEYQQQQQQQQQHVQHQQTNNCEMHLDMSKSQGKVLLPTECNAIKGKTSVWRRGGRLYIRLQHEIPLTGQP
ncbi:hypothetical protein AWZ03_004168 [Drosophila navojoa]|uniref:Uncharacterized protein n=1 Tax=Drosophila navojoa TaxID=7232 RepID=A0A484BNN9_DRONA|nr:hypothetical protein AWZ03_004168 [Drosophila navojoa]